MRRPFRSSSPGRHRVTAADLTAAATRLAGRIRGRAVRHRLPVRAAAATVIAAGAWAGWSLLDSLEADRAAWGERVPIVVADRALQPGDRADATTVSLRAWPAALVPDGALRAVPDAVVRQHVGGGEALGAGDLGPSAGPAGLVPEGWAAVAVPLEEGRRPPLAIGDTVGVVVGGVRECGGSILAVSAVTVIVAVDAAHAPIVATAALDGLVGIVLEPG